ncbi:MAG: glycosyltransferase [Methanophagales archaeon]|nr:glycosyltransferase [Methanophagales archaeon]
MLEVSVVIPTLDEEDSIGRCIEKIKRIFEEHNISGEIIVADNSMDRTPEIAKSAGAKVVTPDKRGYGYAYLYAFEHAKGENIVIGDGDNTYDFSEIPKLLEPLENGEADIVIGSRFKGEIKKGAMPWLHKYIGNPVLTGFLNLFFKAKISDAHCGFRAFKKEALEKMNLKSSGMEFASEMIIEVVRQKLRIKEVPITYYPRGGESKLSSFSDGWRHLKFMLLFSPPYLYLIPGLSLFLFGSVLMLLSFFNIYVGYPPGMHSMILGSLAAIVGYQIIFLGLFAGIYGKKNNLFDPSRLTDFVSVHVSLERGATIGLIMFLTGFAYSLHLLVNWINSGYEVLPMEGQDMIGFTLLVVGLQTIFFSFFFSMVGGEE